VGNSLLIMPNINADRTVTLRLLLEASEVLAQSANIPVPTGIGGVVNQTIDTVRRRTITATLVAKDSLTVAVGGLIEERIHDTRSQVPLLGDIPLRGLLARRQLTGKSRSELIVLIRPYVLNTPAESEAVSREGMTRLSIHPEAPIPERDLKTFDPEQVPGAGEGDDRLREILRFHSLGG